MCGVCGILCDNGSRPDLAALESMTLALAHRGPDGQGLHADGPCGLGHRRLAILDVSEAGAQPMLLDWGRFALAYNGEVYNFRELRRELEALGRAFRSNTDTEVVLAAYAQWGPACVERLSGMFALALWDSRERTLFLARDRYGIKPLYWCRAGGALLFASEVKGLLAHPDAPRGVDLEGLREYMTFQNFFTARTLFAGVSMMPAGTWCLLRPGGPDPEFRRYWDFAFAPKVNDTRTPRELEEELAHLFEQAVRRHLVSDVEVGAYLSGGVDSGSICAVASRLVPGIKSFTCGFDLSSASGLELNFDERGKAERLSYLFGTEHYEAVLKAGDMERCLPAVVRHLEEPRVGQSYPNHYAAGLVSRFCRVVLSGSGGDELFGGYPWRYYRAAASSSFDGFVEEYYAYWQRLIPDGREAEVLAPVWGEVRHMDMREIFRGVFGQRPERLRTPEEYVNLCLGFEAKTFLHGLLMVEDKLAMARGLENRVPFLDNDLVDFATALPVGVKIGNLHETLRLDENEFAKPRQYYQRTRDGKIILRGMLSRFVPEDVCVCEKQGFSGPDRSWFRGDSIEFVRRNLYDPAAPVWSLLDRKACTALVDRHLEGRDNFRLLIWSLLYLNRWLPEFGMCAGGRA
ncbi:asparagine synthase (glutamine-hydrolyzing) [Fundidesulfovibrio soli]|uniref:asparagine synthase (glutamine-hydrolyzing) n=1 Tax=Fundidesulfovibrio soli TaxID=2922716 RepID=UPI001FAF8EB5|nr:asparagine synthase (glutamine-hydrolyzing) [Fundidesulfovibrio soli]